MNETDDAGKTTQAPGRHSRRSGSGEISEDEIDYNLMGTFPASDPPSWTLGIDPPKNEHQPGEHQQDERPDQ